MIYVTTESEDTIGVSQEEMTCKGHCIHKWTAAMTVKTCTRSIQSAPQHGWEGAHMLGGCHFSLKVWLPATCHALVEGTTPMLIQEALTGPL